MAIVSVHEITGASGALNNKFEREYTRKFRVVTDSPLDGTVTVGNAAGIPRIGNPYQTSTETDTGSFCKSIDSAQDGDNPRVWEVTVGYGPSEPGEENPLLRPLEVSWSFAQFTRVADRDINGQGLTNSAGEPFDPPPEMDDSRPVLTVVRNEIAFNPFLAIDYQDAVNADPFGGFAPGTVKVMGISAALQNENNVSYWQVTYEFCFRRDGWQLAILDQGKHKNQNGKLVIIEQQYVDGNGQTQKMGGIPVSDPVPLDGLGQPLNNPSPANAKFRFFNVYKQRAFSAFNF